MIDARGIPTAVCPECGNNEFRIIVKFNKTLYFIENYSLEGQCINCGTQISCPIPINNVKEENT